MILFLYNLITGNDVLAWSILSFTLIILFGVVLSFLDDGGIYNYRDDK